METATKSCKDLGESWEVEDILDERITSEGKSEVLIKWKHQSSYYDNWEPSENLNGCLEDIRDTVKIIKQETSKLKKIISPP